MAGPSPETGIPSEPQAAVAYFTPRDDQAYYEALHREPFFTPEGYDVHSVEGAEAYLTEVHGRDLPQIRGELDASTGFHLAMAMAQEERAALYAEGRRQNDAEHGYNLTVTASWTAAAERPELDLGKVTTMAVYHDLVPEAYGGDTVITDPVAMASKQFREAASMTLFLQDVGDNLIADLIREYEAGESPEARFVRAMDKVEAYQFSLATKGALHRERGERFEEVVIHALPKAVIDPTAFEKMQYVLKHLGRKWNEWGCAPLDSDPEEIVDTMADFLARETGELLELPVKQPLSSSVVQEAMAQVFTFPDPQPPTADEPAGFINIKPVVVSLEDWRQGDGPDHNPPASPSAGILTAA